MTPTIGRIVHYTLSEYDATSIEQMPGRPNRNPVAAGQTYPAVIVRIFGDNPGSHVNLQVFLDGDCSYWATSRKEGTEPGTWAWPARI
jgi:hypothetical protein